MAWRWGEELGRGLESQGRTVSWEDVEPGTVMGTKMKKSYSSLGMGSGGICLNCVGTLHGR